MGSPNASRRFGWLYALWLFGIFAYFLPAPTWNPVSRFDLVLSLVERHTFQIDWLASDTGDKALSNGHWYSDKAPLPGLVVVPLYAALRVVHRAAGDAPTYEPIGPEDAPEARILANPVFRHDLYACSLATAAVAGCAIGVMLFAMLRQRAGPRVALFGSVALTLGSPVFPYSTSFYGHVCAGACLLGALYALTPAAGATWATPARVRWAGAGLAAAVGCEYITAIPVVVVLAWCVASAGRERLLPTCRELLVGAIVPVLLVGMVHTACYGAPWRTGYSHIADPDFAAGHAQGFMGIRLPTWDAIVGLLVGPERGLVYVSPVVAVMAAWWAPTLLERDWIPRAAASAVVALLLANAGYYMWWGGAAAAPRHLVPVVALLALGAPAVWEQKSSRWIGIALAVASIINMLVITGVGLEAPEGENVLQWVWEGFFYGAFAAMPGASNLGMEIGLPRAASLGPVVAWGLVGGRILWRMAGELERTAPESRPSLEAAPAGA